MVASHDSVYPGNDNDGSQNLQQQGLVQGGLIKSKQLLDPH